MKSPKQTVKQKLDKAYSRVHGVAADGFGMKYTHRTFGDVVLVCPLEDKDRDIIAQVEPTSSWYGAFAGCSALAGSREQQDYINAHGVKRSYLIFTKRDELIPRRGKK